MKKRFAAALGLLLLAALLSGCGADEEPFLQKTYTAEETVRAVSIDVRDREIEVTRSADGQTRLLYSENSKEYSHFTLVDGTLTVQSAGDKTWTDYIGAKSSANRKLELQIPDGQLEELRLATTNENLTLQDLTVAGGVTLESNGGDIAFARLDVGASLTVSSKNGDVTGAVVGSIDDFAIESAVKKGESTLPERTEGGEKMLRVSANNGDVDIVFAEE